MIRILAAAIAACILITGCSEPAGGQTAEVSELGESHPEHAEAMAAAEHDGVYLPEWELTAYEVVEAFFEQMYLSYITNEYIDISSILDMNQSVNRSMVTWTKMLLQRRRLIAEHSLGYVNTEQLPYSISFEDGAPDERVEFWSGRGQSLAEGEVMLHFVISGTEGEAYPPIMAMNAVHTMRLRLVDNVWKITMHYFPGAVRKYYRGSALVMKSDEEQLEDLIEEFAQPGSPAGSMEKPAAATAYSGSAAADYALKYTESANTDFYNIGDWMGNCQNFISQSVWYGFKGESEPSVEAMDNMTNKWFAGSGGGSPAWENVGHFWNFITDAGSIGGMPLSGVAELKAGDIIQTSSLNIDDDDGYSHSLIVVDEEKLMLAQNSPGCFVYYSDVVNVKTRIIRPVYLLP